MEKDHFYQITKTYLRHMIGEIQLLPLRDTDNVSKSLSSWQKQPSAARAKAKAETKAKAKAKAKAHKQGVASPWKNKPRGAKAELPKLLPASHPKRGLGAKKAKYRERAKAEKRNAPKKGSKKP